MPPTLENWDLTVLSQLVPILGFPATSTLPGAPHPGVLLGVTSHRAFSQVSVLPEAKADARPLQVLHWWEIFPSCPSPPTPTLRLKSKAAATNTILNEYVPLLAALSQRVGCLPTSLRMECELDFPLASTRQAGMGLPPRKEGRQQGLGVGDASKATRRSHYPRMWF